MATLTGRVRESLVSRKVTSVDSGRGMSWLYVGDKHATKREHEKTIKELMEVFETWKMVRHIPEHRWMVNGKEHVNKAFDMVDYHFIVTSKTGIFLGAAQMSERCGGYTIINYSYRFNTVEELHDFNRKYKDVVSYERVVSE